MSKIIAVATQKGGAGKSTIACNLAVIYANMGKKTLLLDSDLQGSSMDFRAIRSEVENIKQFSATQILTPTINKDIQTFSNFDIIIIDVGGKNTKTFRSALVSADIVIIPIQPSPFDLWATEETLETISQIQQLKPLKAFLLLNMVVVGTSISTEVTDIINQYVEQYDVPLLSSQLSFRTGFKYSIAEGLGITEMPKSKNDKAIEEFESFFKELGDKNNEEEN